MSFGSRLKALMQQQGITTIELAKALGVSRQSVAYWLSDRNCPTPETSQKIAELFETSLVWLRTGIDDIRTEKVLVSEDVENSEEFVFIPEYRLEFGCSPGGTEAPAWIEEPTDKAAYRRRFFQERHISPDKCRRVVADGNSMEPLICDGDSILFVEQPAGTPIRDGYIYAMSYGGALKIKRLYQKANGDIIIHSENPDYKDELVPAADIDSLIRIYGLVIERSGSI